MNPWPFIVAAYGLTVAGTFALLAASWAEMRRAERQLERIGREP